MVFKLNIGLDIAGCPCIKKHTINKTCMVFIFIRNVGVYLIKIRGMDAYLPHVFLKGVTIILCVYYQRPFSQTKGDVGLHYRQHGSRNAFVLTQVPLYLLCLCLVFWMLPLVILHDETLEEQVRVCV